MNTKAFFPCGGGSKLILGTGRKKPFIFFYELQPLSIFFHQIIKKLHFGIKNIITHPDGFV